MLSTLNIICLLSRCGWHVAAWVWTGGAEKFNRRWKSWTTDTEQTPITTVCVCVFFLYSLDFIFILPEYPVYSLYDTIHSSIIPSGNWQRTLNFARRYHTHDGVFCFSVFFSRIDCPFNHCYDALCRVAATVSQFARHHHTNDGVLLYLPLDLFCFISENPVTLLLLFISWILPLWSPLSGDANRHLSNQTFSAFINERCSGSKSPAPVKCWMWFGCRWNSGVRNI